MGRIELSETVAADEDRLSSAGSPALSLSLLAGLRLCSAWARAARPGAASRLRDRGGLLSLPVVAFGRWRYPRGLIELPAAVELVGRPLLFDRGWWVPGDEYWGEVDGAGCAAG